MTIQQLKEFYKGNNKVLELLEQRQSIINEMRSVLEENDKNWRKYNAFYQKGWRKYDALSKELKSNAIEINKLNHCYYDNEKWIYDVFNEVSNKTGNELTKEVATELSSLNGVIVEEDFRENTLNYYVMILTPYKIYSYILSRGYANHVHIEKHLTCKTTNQVYAGSLYDLVYDWDSDEERTNYINKHKYVGGK